MRRKKWIFVLLAIVILASGLIMAFKKIDNQSTKKTLSAAAYRVGGLSTTTGTYIEDKTAIYTQDFITVAGLDCNLKEEPTVSYRVFYFTDAKTFISCTDALNGDTIGTVPATAKYCKICIYTLDDTEISMIQVIGYASELVVKFDK